MEQTNSFGEKETGIMLRFCAEKRERRGGANAQKGAKRGNKICRDNINLSKVSCISIHCILVYSKYINMCTYIHTCMYLYKYLAVNKSLIILVHIITWPRLLVCIHCILVYFKYNIRI